MSYRYISGRGYAVRNADGRVVARGLTRQGLIRLLDFAAQGCVAVPMLGE